MNSRFCRRVPPVAAVAALLFLGSAWASNVRVTIFSTSDLHDHPEPLARIAHMVKEARKQNPNVLLLDAGDMFNRGYTPIMITRGEAMVRLMVATGYDACVLGNHDFSFGTKRLAGLIDKYKLPLVSANTTWAGGAKPKMEAPYRIFKMKGVRVGVIGTTLPDIDHRIDSDITATPVLEAVKKVLPEVRKQADIVVFLAHQSIQRNRWFATQVRGIDLLVGGHDHLQTPKRIWEPSTQTMIFHSGPYGQRVAQVTLEWDGKRIVRHHGWLIRLKPKMPEDAGVKALVKTCLDALSPKAVPVRAAGPLDGAAATRWLASVVRKGAGVDVVIASPEYAGAIPPEKAKEQPVTAETVIRALPRMGIVRFAVDGKGSLDAVLKAVREKSKQPVGVLGEIPATGGVRVAALCVPYDRPLNAEAVGLSGPEVKALERVPDATTWQYALAHLRQTGTVADPGGGK